MTKTIRSAIHTRALRLGALLCLAAAPAALAGCDDPVRAARAADVEVRGDPFVEVGGTLQLTAVVTDAQGAELSGRRVTWESSNPAVAAVQDGVVTGRSLGRATITATSGNVVDSVLVTVEPVVGSAIVFSPTTTLAVGATAQVVGQAVSGGNTALPGVTLRWSTTNPAVATADSGRVRGVGVGTTEVIVAAGSRTARFTLEVVRPYTITRITFPGETANRAAAVNGRGLVVGTVTLAGGQTEAWAWQQGTLMPLGSGRALDVNDRGQVVGSSGADAVMWADGAKTVLYSRPGGFATARAVNVNGQVAGDWQSVNGCGPGGRCDGSVFLYSGGQAQVIVPSATNAAGNGINDQGWVVGTTGPAASRAVHSFVYRNGTLTQLAGGDGTHQARDVNNRGEIVGGGMNAPALRWASPEAAAAPLPSPFPIQVSSGASSINERGDVVGQIQNSGAIWRGGKALDLNYLHVDPQWVVEYASDINEAGVIVGYGRHRTNGGTAALLLTPPAP